MLIQALIIFTLDINSLAWRKSSGTTFHNYKKKKRIVYVECDSHVLCYNVTEG